MQGLIEKIFEPEHLRSYAANNLQMNVRVREKQVKDRAYLKVTIIVPQGVMLEGRATDVMSFEISGKLEGNNKMVVHYLVLWAAKALTELAPQIVQGEITRIPEIAAPELATGAIH